MDSILLFSYPCPYTGWPTQAPLFLLALLLASTISTCAHATPRQAYITSVYADKYVAGALVLAHTIRLHDKNANKLDFLALVFSDWTAHLNTSSLELLRDFGWTIKIINHVPVTAPGLHDRYKDVYSKLLAWNMTEYELLIWLDADTMVVGDLNTFFIGRALQETSANLAAAEAGSGFNSGVLFIRPNKHDFGQLMLLRNNPDFYDVTKLADQSLLNAYYKNKYLGLPIHYNLGLGIYSEKIEMWEQLYPTARILHFTVEKPWSRCGECTRGQQPIALWRRTLQEIMQGHQWPPYLVEYSLRE